MGIKGLISATRTLTIINLPGDEGEALSNSLPWFPVVGAILGLILYGTGWMWSFLPFKQWPSGGALVLVFLGTWLTRGLHLDGLADWADSIGGFHREKRLEIMKDVSLGAFGVLALILCLMAKWICLGRLLSSGAVVWVVAIMSVSRAVLVDLITTLPSARAGKGMAGPFVRGASNKHRSVSRLLSLVLCFLFGPAGLVLFALAWLAARIFGVRCRRQFGGITGDLLGTANEMVEIFLLFICALPGEKILCYTGWGWVFMQ